MSETLKIALTAFAGVAVFTLGQIVQKWLIEPVQQQRRAIAKVVYQVSYYAIQHEGYHFELQQEARTKFREAAAGLLESTAVIPLYRMLSALSIVPKQNIVIDVTEALIKLADDVNYESLHQAEQALHELLKIFPAKKPLTWGRAVQKN